MSRSLTSSDRSSLIKLASSLPVGSPERKAILAGLAGSVTSEGKTASSYRMEMFEELEGFVERLRKEPDWKVIQGKMNDALHFLGKGGPYADMADARYQIIAALSALDKALQHLRMW